MGKDAIFVIGPRGGGKSTILRSLTGTWKHEVRRLITRDGQRKESFVIIQSPQERSPKIAPDDFPEAYEETYAVNRDAYDLLIAPLELDESNPDFSFEKYIQSVQGKDFEVRKIGVIARTQNGTFVDLTPLQILPNVARLKVKLIDAFNDPHTEARKIHP